MPTRCTSELVSNGFLLARIHGVILLTQIAIHHALTRDIVGAESQVVAAQQRSILRSHKHFQMLKEVDIFLGRERNKNTNGASLGGVSEASFLGRGQPDRR